MGKRRLKPATLALLVGAATLTGVVIVRARQETPTVASAHAAVPPDLAQLVQTGAGCLDASDYACAVDAYQKAVALAPDDASLWSALGEARVSASPHDPMPAAALDAFHRTIALAPKDPRARYFLAANRDLSGDHTGAIDDWLAILAETPPGAPWEKDLRRTIEQVGKINAIPVADRLAALKQPAPIVAASGGPTDALPGPSAADLSAASALPPSQQRTMAEAMVERLETRLAADPHNADGWIMLIRSRINLDQRSRAEAALRQALQADPADAGPIRAGAQQSGLN